MTSTLRILSTGTSDLCAPAILLVGPTGKKILVNCGEGCQRAFLEYKQSIKTVSTIALCSLSSNILGGLPGFVLTSADINLAAMNAVNELQNKGNNQVKTSTKALDEPKLNIIGPKGSFNVIDSLRSFMNRGLEKIPLNIIESPQSLINMHGNIKTNKKSANPPDFFIQSLSFESNSTLGSILEMEDKEPQDKRIKLNELPTHCIHKPQVMSYIFTTPPIIGKFDIKKARELGVPRGPLYARLQQGESVTFTCKERKKEVIVQSSQVMSPTTPGVSISVIYCPSDQIFSQLESNVELSDYYIKNDGNDQKSSRFEVMVHMTPLSIIKSEKYMSWLKKFGPDVEHVILNSGDELDLSSTDGFTVDESPFRDYQLDCIARHILCREIYPIPLSWDTASFKREAEVKEEAHIEHEYESALMQRFRKENIKIVQGRNMLEYTIIPRHKRGFNNLSVRKEISSEDCDKIAKEISDSGAVINEGISSFDGEDKRRLIFTGTGSAIPSKNRNVSGMYVTSKSNKEKDDLAGILIDPGEGTIGNLMRLWKGESYQACDIIEKIKNIKLVWISHPHADHHLGLLRLLHLRSQYIKDFSLIENKLFVLGSPPIFDFLDNYSKSCANDFINSYYPLSANAFLHQNKDIPLHQKVSQEVLNHLTYNIGIENLQCVYVSHCSHAYAVLMDMPSSWGKIAYSGDCRPSGRFAEAARNCDILIHEATFENDLEEDAILKKHCTVNEALEVGRQMNANTVVLTHFSQRYPKFQTLTGDYSNSVPLQKVIFAFDGMVLRPSTLSLAADLTGSMRKLYSFKNECEEVDAIDEAAIEPSISSKDVLNTPGLFAVKGFH